MDNIEYNNDNNEREFTAYSRKLLRCLIRIKKCLDNAQYDDAEGLLAELIEDTKSDIEA